MVRTGRRILSRSRHTLSAPLAAALTLLAACEADQAAAPPEPVRPVRHAVVSAGGGEMLRVFSGAAQPDIEARISFRVPGSLRSRPVEAGDTVAPGSLLAMLDERDYEVGVREAEARLVSARASLRNAEASYARARHLYENDSVALSELDAARAAAESAAAQVDIAAQSLADARLKLSYTRITAPARCDVAEVFARVNENVNAGQPIVRLSCGDCPTVMIAMPETQIRAVMVGDEVMVEFSALPGQRFAAHVSEVGVATTAAATTYPVVVRLSGPCAGVRPGMAADVAFRFRAAGEDLIRVPVVAVGEDREGRYVFVLERSDDGGWRARRRSVETGVPQSSGLPITHGLAPGERIVTAGVRRISDGMPVRLFGDGD